MKSSELKEAKSYRARCDINLANIRTNILNIKSGLLKGTKVCAVVKADAYGHGAVPISKYISDIADYFAVADAQEAINLRANAVTKPILILGFVHPTFAPLLAALEITATVFSLAQAKEYDAALKRVKSPEDLSIYKKEAKGEFASEAFDAVHNGFLKENQEFLSTFDFSANFPARLHVHLKLETGMNRLGFTASKESIEEITEISAFESMFIDGAFSHFFESDGKGDKSAKAQLSAFSSFCEKIEAAGVPLPLKHISNSAAAIRFPSANFNMVRLGISMYGLYPSAFVRKIALRPAMSLVSHVVMVKTVKAKESIGYGATFKPKKDILLATVPVGYADGYMRSLSNKGFVLIGGVRAKIVGRVCMDMIMVDVSDVPNVKEGDEVVLVGTQKGSAISMEEISELAGSFNYEFACDVGFRVVRRYV